MPIKRIDFERSNFNRKYRDIDSHPITLLLRENSNLAFTVQEISKRSRKKEDSVRSFLRTLIMRSLIVHRTPYFAWRRAKAKIKKTNRRKK